jgi:hypothetical protein
VGAEGFHADGQTDTTKLIVAFRNFARAPKNRVYFPCLKWTCYIINPLSFCLSLYCSSRLRFNRDCVHPTLTRTSEHSLGTFREEHFVIPSSSSVIINAVTLTMGRVKAVGSGDRIPVGARFSAPVHTGPGAHPASYTMGTGSFLGVKRPGRDFGWFPGVLNVCADVSEHSRVHTTYEDGTSIVPERSAYTIETPGYHPKERVQHLEHGESFSGFSIYFCTFICTVTVVVRHPDDDHWSDWNMLVKSNMKHAGEA